MNELASIEDETLNEDVDLPEFAMSMALNRVQKAFSGKRFSICDIRKVKEIAEIRSDKRWEILKLSHCVDFGEMSKQDKIDLARTTLRFLGMDETSSDFDSDSRIFKILTQG